MKTIATGTHEVDSAREQLVIEAKKIADKFGIKFTVKEYTDRCYFMTDTKPRRVYSCEVKGLKVKNNVSVIVPSFENDSKQKEPALHEVLLCFETKCPGTMYDFYTDNNIGSTYLVTDKTEKLYKSVLRSYEAGMKLFGSEGLRMISRLKNI
jgi:hypothetical protein